METPARIDIHADRWVACIRELAFVGYDFTGATFASQVRAKPDAGGAPLVNLGTVTLTTAEGVLLLYAGEDTVANHIAAGRLDETPSGYADADTIYLSNVRIRINETTMEALTAPDDVGDDITLAWDMHITPAGELKDKYAGGDFIVRAGVTQ